MYGPGTPNGSVQEMTWFFVPGFNVIKPDGEVEYRVSMPTCAGGMCVNICAEGLCNCRIPFYVFLPTGDTSAENKVGSLTKIWAGLGTEVSTQR